MDKIKEIINNSLFELVKETIRLSEEFDNDDYYNCAKEYPDSKVQWIVEKLTS